MKRGKRYQEAEKLVDKKKNYSVKEAIETIEKMTKPKFDETEENNTKYEEDVNKIITLGKGMKRPSQYKPSEQYYICLLYTSARLKLKGIDGGPHKQWSMWFNSKQREEPYQGLTYR